MGQLESRYDAIVIGAGMSGMAAAIRLAMYDKKVCLLERHRISGGLNSYYNRGKRKLDVGLHALTNFMDKGERGKPLAKLLKQLRIPYDQLQLCPQKKSRILFPDHELTFTNDIGLLVEEVAQAFPQEIDGFVQLLEKIKSFDEVNLDNEFLPAKTVVAHFIKDPALLEMIFCPLLIYGSALEEDMDFSQFVIMFKSIYLEGFGRPEGGVRRIIDLLEQKLSSLGTPIHFGHGVEEILTRDQKAYGVRLANQQIIEAPLILSSMGLAETLDRTQGGEHDTPHGKLSFTESILFTQTKPKEIGLEETIIFYNNRPHYQYRRPDTLVDLESAVICLPNNFAHDDLDEGVIRLTHIAHYEKWKALDRVRYKEEKNKVFDYDLELIKKIAPRFNGNVDFKDVFSPTTVERYTWHYAGAVYGSPQKTRRGLTDFSGLIIIGTDQGFLGIVGAMLSGISMANLHGLQGGAPS